MPVSGGQWRVSVAALLTIILRGVKMKVKCGHEFIPPVHVVNVIKSVDVVRSFVLIFIVNKYSTKMICQGCFVLVTPLSVITADVREGPGDKQRPNNTSTRGHHNHQV